MTNFEAIKSSNLEELTELIYKLVMSYCGDAGDCYHCKMCTIFGGCTKKEIRAWLKQNKK